MVVCGTEMAYAAMVLCGSEIAYAATPRNQTRETALLAAMVVCGTEIAYAGEPLQRALHAPRRQVPPPTLPSIP
eukprot:3090214-Rhodomonas_salina.1